MQKPRPSSLFYASPGEQPHTNCCRCDQPLEAGDHTPCHAFEKEKIVYQFGKGSEGVAVMELRRSSFRNQLQNDPEVRAMVISKLNEWFSDRTFESNARVIAKAFNVPNPFDASK